MREGNRAGEGGEQAMKILIAEDDATERRILQAMVEKWDSTWGWPPMRSPS